jgi:hypothetical protein
MFKKNKKIKFNNVYPKLVDIFPEPEAISKNLPDWFKEQPVYFNNDKTVYNGFQKITVKKCPAIFDIMSCGYILKCPIDIFIDTTVSPPKFDIPPQFANLKYPIMSFHSSEQVSHYPIDKDNEIDYVIRINMVWLVSTEKGHSSLFIDPQHKDRSPLRTVSAIIDTDVFQSDGNFSFFVQKNFKGILKMGTPLVQVVPFKRDNWESSINKKFDPISGLRYQRFKVRSMFSNGYKKFFWNKKEYK